MNVNEVLKKRYGGDRFNPVAGQSQMSFQEWMDRHPSLQGARKGVAYDKYKSATSEKGGQEFLRGAPSIDGPVKPPEMFDKMAEHKGFAAGRPNMQQQMGGPDAPPDAARKQTAGLADNVARNGISQAPNAGVESMYSEAKGRANAEGGMRGVVGAIRGANQGVKPQTAMAAASRRQAPAKKKSAPVSTKGNTQKQHPQKRRPSGR